MPASPRRQVRCAIYTRQSVGSSDGLSSCEVQYEACSLYLQSQRVPGWTLLTERFDDDGYSGATLDRPALNRLLTLVRRGQIDRILIHRLDRLSRDVRDYAALLDELRRLEVTLVIVTAPEFGDSAQDSFMLNIMASFAEFERELIADRIAESRARLKARHLRFAGGVPFGYDSNRRTREPIPVNNDAVEAVIDQGQEIREQLDEPFHVHALYSMERKTAGRRTIKRGSARQVVDGKGCRLADEIAYIQDKAADHDGRIVTIGQLILFATDTGDAWLIDVTDQLAARPARDGDSEPIYLEETIPVSPSNGRATIALRDQLSSTPMAIPAASRPFSATRHKGRSSQLI